MFKCALCGIFWWFIYVVWHIIPFFVCSFFKMKQPMWFSLESLANGHPSQLRLASMEMDWNRKTINQFPLWHFAVFTEVLIQLNVFSVCICFVFFVCFAVALCVLARTSSCSQKRAMHWLAFSCQELSMKKKGWMRLDSAVRQSCLILDVFF